MTTIPRRLTGRSVATPLPSPHPGAQASSPSVAPTGSGDFFSIAEGMTGRPPPSNRVAAAIPAIAGGAWSHLISRRDTVVELALSGRTVYARTLWGEVHTFDVETGEPGYGLL